MAKKRDIPLFDYPIVETHCHLDYLKDQDLNETLAEAAQYGIEKIMTIAVSAQNLDPVLAMAKEHPQIFCSQGIHPHDANDFSASVLEKIKTNAADKKVLAIGECGLDFFYDHGERNKQLHAFEQQLQLACECDLPVVIHTREADADTHAILKNFSHSLKKKGVIHSFTSGMELAEFCLNDGYCLGFNGICTFNKAENVREVIAITPLDKILLETDAPYLTPAPYRGRPNAPKYLPFIAEKVAEVKEVDVTHILKVAYENSHRVFGFPSA